MGVRMLFPAIGAAATGAAAGLFAWAVRGKSSSLLAPSVCKGPRSRRAIALTFDDGPSKSTPRILELLAASAGQYRYIGSVGLLPLWVAALWLLFAATLNSSLAWLSGRPLLAAALGALAGPLSFKAGVGLGAGEYLTTPLHASAVLAILWSLALPGAFVVSRLASGRSS